MSKHVVVALTNPKSPTNVGAVMRAAGCYGVDKVVYSGKRYERAAKFHTDTQNITNSIELVCEQDFVALKAAGKKMVCVELVEGATSLPKFEHPEDALYVFGPEDGTIEQRIIDQSDDVVYVPTIGCMNLAATVNVLLYDRLAKSDEQNSGDELIRSSRDTNNKVFVK